MNESHYEAQQMEIMGALVALVPPELQSKAGNLCFDLCRAVWEEAHKRYAEAREENESQTDTARSQVLANGPL